MLSTAVCLVNAVVTIQPMQHCSFLFIAILHRAAAAEPSSEMTSPGAESCLL